MANVENGGPAFPPHAPAHYGQGMSLRDYFAGQFLIGLCQADMSEEQITVSPALLARTAYSMADAMLSARAASAGDSLHQQRREGV